MPLVLNKCNTAVFDSSKFIPNQFLLFHYVNVNYFFRVVNNCIFKSGIYFLTNPDSQDVELDAILGELCALEDKLDREIMPKSQSANQALGNAWNVSKSNCSAQNQNNSNKNQSSDAKFTSGHSRSNSGGGGTRPKFEIGGLQVTIDQIN